MKRIQQVLTAKIDDSNEEMDGMSSFAALMQGGSDKMEVRLEQARQAMSAPKMSKAEENEEILNMACRVTGARGRFVTPTRKLPRAGRAGAQMKHDLNQVRMKKIRKLKDEGDDIDIEAYIDAVMNNEEMDAPYFVDKSTEAGFELLIIGDVSGSMLGHGMNMLEQAIADTAYACGPPLKVELTLWTYSDIVFFFKKLGSPKGATGQAHGMTNMVQALDVAYEWAKKAKNTRAIIHMTDGMPSSLRGRNSTGNTIQDLRAVIEEMRLDGIIMSTLALGPEHLRSVYDQGFGKGKYALLSNLPGLMKALPEAARQLVEAHIKKGRL
jgi:Mg-chelatase subunit ChlD